MHESVLILTLTGSLAAALALGYVTQRLKLSPIIGYLLAGLIVGPYTPGFVADRALAREFAEVGIVLLMFGVGLQFHLNDLLAVRNIAILGALTQSAITTLLGMLAGHAFQWSWSASVVFGLSLSVASTVMLTRVLVDTADLQTPAGRIAIGWLVVEDIFTVLVLVLLPAVLLPSTQQTALALVVAITFGKLVVLAVFAFVVVGGIIPRILNSVAATGSRELFTLAVLVIALGIAVGSSMAFGVSLALGAFLAGMIVGRSEFSMRAASDALPMRDAFAVLFFVSVGMLLDPRALMKSPRVLLITLAIVLLAKPIVAFLITAVMGYDSQIGIRIAVALAQIGEFSLILATVGDQLKIFPEGTTNVVVAASIISLSLNPLLYRSIGPLNGMFSRVFSRQPGDSEKRPRRSA
jgi:CPA2 family monovalent cation:H+ antiporter-2